LVESITCTSKIKVIGIDPPDFHRQKTWF